MKGDCTSSAWGRLARIWFPSRRYSAKHTEAPAQRVTRARLVSEQALQRFASPTSLEKREENLRAALSAAAARHRDQVENLKAHAHKAARVLKARVAKAEKQRKDARAEVGRAGLERDELQRAQAAAGRDLAVLAREEEEEEDDSAESVEANW